jgi:proteasome-associated ATPase
MAKKNNRNRGDEWNETDSPESADSQSTQSQNVDFNEGGWQLPETQLKATALLDELLRGAAGLDTRTRQYLLLLRHQLQVDEQQMQEAAEAISEFEDAYQKLTQPANRIGVYLGKPAGDSENSDSSTRNDTEEIETASIAVGDQEFIVLVDPKLEKKEFQIGTRVKVNEAYAIVGDLGQRQTARL